MTDVDLKNLLLAGDPADDGDNVEEVATHAGTVTVRGLTRGEVMALQKIKEAESLDAAQWEQRLVSKGLVSPQMSPSEVERWQAVDKAKGALADVADAISRLSGFGEGAQKSSVSSTTS